MMFTGHRRENKLCVGSGLNSGKYSLDASDESKRRIVLPRRQAYLISM